MYRYLLLFLAHTLSAAAFAQGSAKRNTLYAELLGNGIAASINYERQLQAEPGLGIRLGMGYFSGDERFRVSIPLGVNYLFALKSKQSFLDAGIGGTWSAAAGLKTVRQEAVAGRDDSEHIWSLIPSIGYRRHTKGHFMWRASFTPVFNKYRAMPWVGIAVGKGF